MRLVLALVLALPAMAPAAAQERTWILDDNPEAPRLIYGAPESDDILISFSCEPDQRRMTIVEAVGTKKLDPGRAAAFRMSVGAASLELTGDSIANEIDGSVNIEVTGAPNPRVFALLKSGPSLVIEIAGEKATIPLAAAAPHVPLFEKLCLAKK